MNNNNNNERVFWKVIHNKYLFKIILQFLSHDFDSNSLRPMYSVKWLIENGYRKILIHKLLNNHFLEFDYTCNNPFLNFKNIISFLSSKETNDSINIEKKEEERNKEKEIYRIFFNRYLPSQKSLLITENQILYSLNFIAFKVLYKNGYLEIYNRDLFYTPTFPNEEKYFKFKYWLIKKKIKCYGDCNDYYDNDIIKLWKDVNETLQDLYKEGYFQIISIQKKNGIVIKKLVLCIKYLNILLINHRNSISIDYEPLTQIYNSIFKVCPFGYNFKIDFLYNVCLAYSIIQYQREMKIPHYILREGQLKSIDLKNEIEKKLRISDELNNDKVKRLLEIFIEARRNIHDLYSPLFYYEFNNNELLLDIEEKIKNYNSSEVLALRFANFRLLKKWFIIKDKSFIIRKRSPLFLDLEYHLYINNENSVNNSNSPLEETSLSKFFNNLMNLFNNINNNEDDSIQIDERKITRLSDYFKHESQLFINCKKDKIKQIQFINQVCNEIISNPKQFKLHPLIFLQLVIFHDDLELVKVTYDNLSCLISSESTITPPPNYVKTNTNKYGLDALENDINIYNPLFIFEYIKSINIFEFIFEKFINFKNFDSKINWLRIRQMYDINKQVPSNPIIMVGISNVTHYLYSNNSNNNNILFNVGFELLDKSFRISTSEYFKRCRYYIENSNCKYSINLLLLKKLNISEIQCLEFIDWLYKERFHLDYEVSSIETSRFIIGEQELLLFKYIAYSWNNDNQGLVSTFFDQHSTIEQFFNNNKFNTNSILWINLAFKNGDLNILKLFFNQYFEGDEVMIQETPYKLYYFSFLYFIKSFIMEGHLSIIKWLHLNQLPLLTFLLNQEDDGINTVVILPDYLLKYQHFQCLEYCTKFIKNKINI